MCGMPTTSWSCATAPRNTPWRLREELHSFLSSSLRLPLSLEKTKVTHLDDGFDFLGFRLRRSMGAEGMGVKTTIADKAMRRHLDYLRAATAPDRTDDAVAAKIRALNHAIAGWCRYFQPTSRASAQFHQMEHRTFWMMRAGWRGSTSCRCPRRCADSNRPAGWARRNSTS